jgi:hypothetical protein
MVDIDTGWPIIVEARVQFQGSLRTIFGGKIGIGTSFSPGTLVSLSSYCIFIVMSYCTFIHLLYIYVFIVCLYIHCMFIYSLYVYVSLRLP